MNDFTKDELENILMHLQISVDEDSINISGLYLKINGMIENYCVHNYMRNSNNCIDCGISEYRCNKCGYVSYEGLE
jgi:hypothetical protein